MKKSNYILNNSLFLIFLLSTLYGCTIDEKNLINDTQGDFQSFVTLPVSADRSVLPIEVADNFIWGINGHPITNEDYYSWGFSDAFAGQVIMLKQLQVDYYRVNFVTDNDGLIVSSDVSNWNNLKSAIINENSDVQIIPVIQHNNYDSTVTANVSRLAGKSKALGFATAYGSNFDYYQIGNEMDKLIYLGPNGAGQNGSHPSHYDPIEAPILIAYLKGMEEGIHQVNKDAKIIISCTGYKKWGYYQLLEDSNVDFDIIGWHWYSAMVLNDDKENPFTVELGGENVLTELESRFPLKDLWITEISRKYGSYDDSEEDQADWMNAFITGLDERFKVGSHFPYELLDQPIRHAGKNDKMHHGIIKSSNNHARKIAFNEYKYRIENIKNGYEDFVWSLYLYLNLREPGGGLEYWSDILRTNRDTEALVNSFIPQESYRVFIENLYLDILGRPGDESGIDYWESQMKNNNKSRESVISSFCSGTEFYNSAGGTNAYFINEVFLVLLGRYPDSNELDLWLDLLDLGHERSNMVDILLQLSEYHTKFIEEQFIALLRRTVQSGGLNYYLGEMQNGITQQQVIIRLVLSKEYWRTGIIEGYERNTGYPFY